MCRGLPACAASGAIVVSVGPAGNETGVDACPRPARRWASEARSHGEEAKRTYIGSLKLSRKRFPPLNQRVVRGGCAFDSISSCGSANRQRVLPDQRYRGGSGFRVVLDLDPQQAQEEGGIHASFSWPRHVRLLLGCVTVKFVFAFDKVEVNGSTTARQVGMEVIRVIGQHGPRTRVRENPTSRGS